MLARAGRQRAVRALATALRATAGASPATECALTPAVGAGGSRGAGWTAPPLSRGFAASSSSRGKFDDDSKSDAFDGAAAGAADAPASTLDAAAGALASFDPTDAIAAASAAEQAALAAAKDGVWLFNSGFQNLLESVHAATGLPWWGAIAVTTVAARTLMLPVVGKQMRNTQNMTAARPEMLALQDWFKQKQLEGGDMQALAGEYQHRLAAVWAKHDCHPIKSLGPLLLQAPLFIGFFSALRSLAGAQVPSLTHGGTLWFHDLTLADPTYGLPLVSAAIFLLTVELGAADGMQGQDPKVMARMKTFMRVLAAAMVPLTASMPAGVFVYWATSNAYSLLQAAAFKATPVRRLFNLAPLQRVVTAVPASAPSQAAAAAAAAGKPVVTYATRPKGAKKGRK